MSPPSPPSTRATVRYKGRGSYERALIEEILDEAVVCHLGLVQEDGSPLVLPTLFARDGDAVYVHGSPASRLLRTAKQGVEVCLTVSGAPSRRSSTTFTPGAAGRAARRTTGS